MRTGAALLCLALVSPALAEDRPWPQKGDTVYVSADLAGFRGMMVFGTGAPAVPDLPACAPVTVKSISSDGSMVKIRDDQVNTRKLAGDWTKYLHRDKAACKARVDSAGLPRVEAHGGTLYRLIG